MWLQNDSTKKLSKRRSRLRWEKLDSKCMMQKEEHGRTMRSFQKIEQVERLGCEKTHLN